MNHYEDVIEEFCKDNRDLDIYLAGEVSHPGISDLDFLVLDEKPKISERVKEHLKGGNVIIFPSHLFHKIDYIEQFNLKLLQGQIREREKPPEKEFKTVEIIEWSPERLLYSNSKKINDDNIHLAIKSVRRSVDNTLEYILEHHKGFATKGQNDSFLLSIDDIRKISLEGVSKQLGVHHFLLSNLLWTFECYFERYFSPETLTGVVSITDYYDFCVLQPGCSSSALHGNIRFLLNYWKYLIENVPCELSTELSTRCDFRDDIHPTIIDKDFEAFIVERWKLLNEVFVWFKDKGFKKGMIKYGWFV